MKTIYHTIILVSISVFLFSCGGKQENSTSEVKPADGKSVFEAQCTRCHGSNGKLGLSGAKDLTITTLTPDEMIPVITNGRNGGLMPTFKDVLSAEEIKLVAGYVETNLKN